MYDKIIIGLDQSYQNTGICVAADNKVKLLKGLNLSKFKSNTEKRSELRIILNRLINNLKNKSKDISILIERIRLHSAGFVNIDYIKSIGALNAVIVDVANEYGIKVYSVDTRAWKSQVIGTSKPEKNNFGVDENKWPTVKFVIKNKLEKNILIEITTRKRKGTFERDGKIWMYDNDIADSCGIALYGFRGNKKLLKEEK